MVVTIRGIDSTIELLRVKDLRIEERKPMIFIIGGGIMAPFTALAYYHDLLNPQLALLLMLGGLFAMYYGWTGYPVLSIRYFTYHRDIRLKSVGTNLRAFVEFARKHLPANKKLDPQKKLIYHITTKKDWKKYSSEQHYSIPGKPFIHASEYEQLPGTLKKHFKNRQWLLLLSIDPLKVRPEIRYEDLEGEGQVFPHIYGALNLDAIQKIEEIRSN